MKLLSAPVSASLVSGGFQPLTPCCWSLMQRCYWRPGNSETELFHQWHPTGRSKCFKKIKNRPTPSSSSMLLVRSASLPRSESANAFQMLGFFFCLCIWGAVHFLACVELGFHLQENHHAKSITAGSWGEWATGQAKSESALTDPRYIRSSVLEPT